MYYLPSTFIYRVAQRSLDIRGNMLNIESHVTSRAALIRSYSILKRFILGKYEWRTITIRDFLT
jgi:hypothetical protein